NIHPNRSSTATLTALLTVLFLIILPPPRSTLFPYTTLFRSGRVAAAQKATSEGVRFLADHPGFPLRAPSDLAAIIDALGIEGRRSEEHTSELQSRGQLVCRLLLEKKKKVRRLVCSVNKSRHA